MSVFVWVDPDDGETYEMRYVVTQFEDEGPEYVEWRNVGKNEAEWQKLPPWATPPQEAIEFWHGPTIRWWENAQEGVIVAMNDEGALCVNPNRDIFTCTLVVFENVSNPDGDEVRPGDVIRTDAAYEIRGPGELRKWFGADE